VRRIGASTFIWTSPFGDDKLELCAHVAGLGFDAIEICIEDPHLSAPSVARAAEAAEIGVLVCGAFGSPRDVSHPDPAIRAQAAAYVRRCVDIAATIGSPIVAGPMYAATGQTRLLSAQERTEQRRRAVETLQDVGGYAAERGVALAIEPLNRFETDLVNTTDQGIELCRDIACANVGLLLDTFHMNIEEKQIGEAIRRAGPLIRHFHACENDRGAPGSGHIDWADVFAALDDVGYDGDIVIESFTPEIKEIARAVSMWRPLAASPDSLAADGLSFLRSVRDLRREPSGRPADRHIADPEDAAGVGLSGKPVRR
jgi:D-psicose/D-tagatose/L-ribulose 3-epimerase